MRYIDLDNHIKDVIISCIDRIGYINVGYLKYRIDLYLAAGLNNLIFEPCTIKEGILIITFRQRGIDYIEHKSYDIENIIQDYLKEDKWN